MKRMLYIVIVLGLVLATGISILAVDDDFTLLSELTDEECLEFLKENGIQIPTIYDNELDCVPFVRTVIRQIEENPNDMIHCKTYMLLEFALEIKKAVDTYYSGMRVTTYETSTSSDLLQDNIKHVEWDEDFLKYNCYGYAIGDHKWIKPGFSDWITRGNDIAAYYCNGYANMATLADWVEMDLVYYGYTVNLILATMPDTQVSDHVHLICIRKDLQEITYINELGNLETNHDFHFMKLDEDGYWYQKPGYTSPLKYKYIPSNELAWVHEGYNGLTNEYFREESFAYESEIYFIEYTTPHVWEVGYYGMTSGGTHQHISRCTVCGDANGDPMNCMYLLGSNICRFCGHNKNTAVGVYGLFEELQPVV